MNSHTGMEGEGRETHSVDIASVVNDEGSPEDLGKQQSRSQEGLGSVNHGCLEMRAFGASLVEVVSLLKSSSLSLSGFPLLFYSCKKASEALGLTILIAVDIKAVAS